MNNEPGSAHALHAALLNHLLQNVPDRVYFKDRDSRFIFISKEMSRLFGLNSPDEAIGKTDFDVFATEHAAQAHADEQELMRTGRPMVGQDEKETWPDGTISWVTTTKIPMRNAAGEVIGIFGISRDITERVKAEEALREAVNSLQRSQKELQAAHLTLIQAEKMETVGRLAASVAHEVKNPLQILLMSVDYLRQRLQDRDGVLDGVLRDMSDAAWRANHTIQGLLDFSRSDELKPQPQDLNGLVENALSFVRHPLASQQISLRRDLAPDLPRLTVDGMKIQQVLINLLTNAIDATPHGGTVTVATRAIPAGAVLEIADTGHGIPTEVLAKIFDPFFTTKSTGKGTGLGLSVVKRILDLHHATIEILNEPAGGTLCRVTLPIRGAGEFPSQ